MFNMLQFIFEHDLNHFTELLSSSTALESVPLGFSEEVAAETGEERSTRNGW